MDSNSTFYNYCVMSSVNDILLIDIDSNYTKKSERRATQHARCETRSR